VKAVFFAPGIPKGQPRPRAFSRNGHAREDEEAAGQMGLDFGGAP
jgi:hypothetical protein